MSASTVYDFTVTDIKGNDLCLDTYRGQVLLIVNVASRCGYTKQYTGLQALEAEFAEKGFHVLGFPCNQFMGQEPGSNEEIEQFCALNFNVTFPMFDKIDVNGSDTHPLYKHLKKEKPGLLGSEAIKWNFTKFLVDRNGKVVGRYGSVDTPEQIREDILKLL